MADQDSRQDSRQDGGLDVRKDSPKDLRAEQPEQANQPADTGYAGSAGAMSTANRTQQGLPAGALGAGEMGAPAQGVLGTSGEFSNQDDVAGFGPKGAGGLHGTPPTWFGSPIARAEEQAEQGGNIPATTPIPEASGATSAGGQGMGANRNDWQVSTGEAQAADQQPATGTEARGSFEPVGGDDSISALPGAPNPD